MLQKLVINKIIELLSKQFKLFDVLKYVKEPNELDVAVKKLKKETTQLKKENKIILREIKDIKDIKERLLLFRK